MRQACAPNPFWAAALVPLLLAGCDRSVENPAEPSIKPVAPAGPEPVRLAHANDRDWIRLNGKVLSTMASAFLLDYGAGNVLVEMDDWDWYQEGKLLKPGDEVIVEGYADKDSVNESVEAAGVYVKNLNTYFHASGIDEERLRAGAAHAAGAPGSRHVTGIVRSVSGREFTIGSSGKELGVDTKLMVDNPLDQKGPLQITPGDRVYVYGDLDIQRIERAEIMARGIIKLAEDSSKAGPPRASAMRGRRPV